LQAIAALQQLQCLGLGRCPAAHASALPALVAALPRLTRLHLNHVPMSDLALSALLRVSPVHCCQPEALRRLLHAQQDILGAHSASVFPCSTCPAAGDACAAAPARPGHLPVSATAVGPDPPAQPGARCRRTQSASARPHGPAGFPAGPDAPAGAACPCDATTAAGVVLALPAVQNPNTICHCRCLQMLVDA
jgi:hypothetical protein